MPSAKAAEAIAASLGRIYGSEVEVLYHDTSDPGAAREFAGLIEDLAVEHIPLPATFLDGELIYAGAINPMRVVVEVAERLRRARPVAG